MVVHAFAAGDSATLRSLMAPEAFANFDNAIRARLAKGQTMTTTVVSIDEATIVGAQLVGATAQLTVRFAAKLCLRDSRPRRRGRRRVGERRRRPYRFVDLRARRALARSQLDADCDGIGRLSPGSRAGDLMPPRLAAFDFESLAGWTGDDHLAALRTFERSARALVAGRAGSRPASPPSPGLIANAHAALSAIITDERDARRFFETRFRPFRVVPDNKGFLTGYYEPCVAASRVQTEEFRWPILGRPADLVTFAPRADANRISGGNQRR